MFIRWPGNYCRELTFTYNYWTERKNPQNISSHGSLYLIFKKSIIKLFCFSYVVISVWCLPNVYCLSQPFKRQPHKMAKHTQTICRLLPTNCLSVFNHFVRLALKGLTCIILFWNFKISIFTKIFEFLERRRCFKFSGQLNFLYATQIF